jgi:hypothetical protein
MSDSATVTPQQYEGHRRRYEGVERFLSVIDAVRMRPSRRQGDRPIPVLAISGPDNALLAAARALTQK